MIRHRLSQWLLRVALRIWPAGADKDEYEMMLRGHAMAQAMKGLEPETAVYKHRASHMGTLPIGLPNGAFLNYGGVPVKCCDIRDGDYEYTVADGRMVT
jgi:hypothetical protein